MAKSQRSDLNKSDLTIDFNLEKDQLSKISGENLSQEDLTDPDYSLTKDVTADNYETEYLESLLGKYADTYNNSVALSHKFMSQERRQLVAKYELESLGLYRDMINTETRRMSSEFYQNNQAYIDYLEEEQAQYNRLQLASEKGEIEKDINEETSANRITESAAKGYFDAISRIMSNFVLKSL